MTHPSCNHWPGQPRCDVCGMDTGHPTYANLSDEERAGLDAREARRTEREMLQTIDERDRAEAAADELAYAIAPMEVIGEHSNLNDPWRNALEEVDNLRAEAVAAERARLRQAIPQTIGIFYPDTVTRRFLEEALMALVEEVK